MEGHHDCMLWDNGHYLVLHPTVFITHQDILYQYHQITLRIGIWFRTSPIVRVLSTFLLYFLGIVNTVAYRVVCHVCTNVYHIGGEKRDT